MILSKPFQILLLGGIVAMGGMASAQEKILCITTQHEPVYLDNLKDFVFSGERYETVVPFQSFGPSKKVKKTVKLKGQIVTFIKAEFTDREEEDAENSVGWVRESQVKLKKDCPHFKASKVVVEDDRPSVNIGNITGLTDSKCCRFPLATQAHADYRQSPRSFGAGRSGGRRKHAGADLYHRQWEPVYAVADGVLLRDREGFYGGTAATEVLHSGGFVVRYGEIAFQRDKKLTVKPKVKAGDLLGYVKATTKRRGFNPPMLHFELYSGKVKGALTVAKGGGAYQRRSDLMNPTPYLQKWESKR